MKKHGLGLFRNNDFLVFIKNGVFSNKSVI